MKELYGTTSFYQQFKASLLKAKWLLHLLFNKLVISNNDCKFYNGQAIVGFGFCFFFLAFLVRKFAMMELYFKVHTVIIQ